MRRLGLSFSMAVLASALAACGGGSDSAAGGSTAQPSSAPYNLTLQAGVPAVIAAEQLSLSLSAVDESRCPAQVQCVWAGQAVARIEIQQAGQAAAMLVLSTQAEQSAAGYRGYRITLTGVDPAPVEARPIPLDQYRVGVRVDKD